MATVAAIRRSVWPQIAVHVYIYDHIYEFKIAKRHLKESKLHLFNMEVQKAEQRI